MRILLTGHQGFTGRYVKSELEKHQHEVIGLTSDLLDFKSVAEEIKRIQPTGMVHLAAVTFVAHANIREFYQVNLIGTHHLLEATHKYCPNIQSILIASSANVYGNSELSVLSEDSPVQPANDYAVSKLAMEKMAKLWLDRLPLFIVRPFNYTGIGQGENFLIPKIVQHFKKRATSIQLGNLDVWREFGDVRMVAEVYRKLLEICPAGKTINICTGEAYSLREVIDLSSDLTQHQLSIEVNPDFVRANEVRMLKGDNSLLKELVPNWTKKSLRETLTWMLQ